MLEDFHTSVVLDKLLYSYEQGGGVTPAATTQMLWLLILSSLPATLAHNYPGYLYSKNLFSGLIEWKWLWIPPSTMASGCEVTFQTLLYYEGKLTAHICRW